MKKTKFFIYYTLIVIIYSCFFMFNKNVNPVMKYIGYGLLGVEALLLIIVFFYYKRAGKENKVINQLMNEEKYEEAEKLLKDKIENETNITRKDAFYYSLMVCLLSEAKDGEAILLYDKMDSKLYYPIVHYYKAAVEFSNGCYTNIEKLYGEFSNSYDVIRHYEKTYKGFDMLFKAMISFSKNDPSYKDIINSIDIDRYKLNCTVKIIQKLTGNYNV